ncbi:MAG: hypothetical protein L6V93_05795 [Clostridiales bacterium]|nr:MAG: hypothetical protein L6V93_05795 [Clostridiales bacterium]
MFNLTDGALHLDRNCMPYMYNEKNVPMNFRLALCLRRRMRKNEFTLIFGAGRADGFKLNSKHMSDAHYELIFSDNSASVMLCKNGIKSAVASVDGTNIKIQRIQRLESENRKGKFRRIYRHLAERRKRFVRCSATVTQQTDISDFTLRIRQ